MEELVGLVGGMKLVFPQGTYPPDRDTFLILDAMARLDLRGLEVADPVTGPGTLSVFAQILGARVSAVDISSVAVAAATANAIRNVHDGPVALEVFQGDLYGPLQGREFDVIVANPPCSPVAAPLHAIGDLAVADALTWNGGEDGRRILDRIIEGAEAHLTPDGRLVVVHSALAGVDETLVLMDAHGLRPRLERRDVGPPRRVTEWLAQVGLSASPGATEELVLISGRKQPTTIIDRWCKLSSTVPDTTPYTRPSRTARSS